MSEYQNKVIELMLIRAGESAVLDKTVRRQQFLRQALELYRAMGGAHEAAGTELTDVFRRAKGDAVIEIGEVMESLACIGHAYDIDIIQAAYNRLEEGWKQFGGPPVQFD